MVAGGHSWLMGGGHAWLWGVCVVAGGHVWLQGGACIGYDEIWSMSGRYASSGGSKGGHQGHVPPLGAKILSFSCSF